MFTCGRKPMAFNVHLSVKSLHQTTSLLFRFPPSRVDVAFWQWADKEGKFVCGAPLTARYALSSGSLVLSRASHSSRRLLADNQNGFPITKRIWKILPSEMMRVRYGIT